MRSFLYQVALLLAIISVLQVSECSRILFLLPVASKSHVHVFEPMIRALGERGHEVVSFQPVESKGMPPTVKQHVIVPIEDIFKKFDSPFRMRTQSKWVQFTNTSMEYIEETSKKVLQSPEMLGYMHGKEKFDLVVVDILMNYCVLGVLPFLKAPYIYVSTLAAPSFITDPLGNRLPPSFVPSPFLSYSDKMTFLERVVNFTFNIFMDFMGYFFFVPKLEKIYQDQLKVDTSIFDIDANVSMVLVNSHFSLTYPRPNLPDVVDVGGMHMRPSKPLPRDLEEFISGAEHGCIFFSLGSIAQGKDMPEEYRKVFVKVFSRLKQRVLWKWETETMPDLPKNVKLGKWLPQQDILGHKNIKLFMTHGGLLSIQETIYHGKPLLGIPLFADQDLNVKNAMKSGFALSLEILEINEETLESKLNDLLSSPKYQERVDLLSKVFKDQPLTPLETAVFWCEYIIRHKGANHMRSAARDLNFFQHHSLDVIAFLLSIFIAVIFTFKCIIKFLVRKVCGCFRRKGKVVKTQKKTN